MSASELATGTAVSGLNHTTFFQKKILRLKPAPEMTSAPLPQSVEREHTTFFVRQSDNQVMGYLYQLPSVRLTVECYEGKGGNCLILTEGPLRIMGITGSRISGDGWELCLYDYDPENPAEPWNVSSITQTTPATPQQSVGEVQTVTEQAMILGAGLATRFEPVSGDRTGYSKPGTPLIGEQSVIRVLAEHLKKQGIKRILINTFYKAESLKAGLDGIDGVTFYFIDEKKPSGTAGALRTVLDNPTQFAGALDVNKPLLILQGDAVTDTNFTPLLTAHQQHNALVSLGCMVKPDEDVNKFGIVATDQSADDGKSGNIDMFLEKPTLQEAGPHRLANTGFYVFSPSAYPLVQQVYANKVAADGECEILDFAMDVFPAVMQKAKAEGRSFWAQMMGGYWSDIGNASQYVQSVYDLYNSETGLDVPGNSDEYIQDSVVYWPGTYSVMSAMPIQLSGKVIVTRPAAQ